MASRHLLIFTRWPQPGRTKTRLIPTLGAKGAAELQEWLTGHALLQARLWAKQPHQEIRVLTTGASLQKFRNWLGPDVLLQEQSQGDLGDRLSTATQLSFNQSAEHVCMIGIDCPGITATVLDRAFEALEGHDAVIAPATDGGYTLLGCTSHQPGLFQNISWGTDDVFEQTRRKLEETKTSFTPLPALQDIDDAEDLAELENVRSSERSPGLSVIIPAMNEEASIQKAVQSVQQEADEVIVVDAGSHDRTRELASNAGATVLSSEPGRGRQMNLGAAQASFDTLLFLHADSELPPGCGEVIRQALQTPENTLTAFHLGIRGSRKAYRWIESAVRLRSNILKRPYGDQALALKRETFVRLGGYANLPLLEDLNLVRRAARRGRIRLLPLTVQVSDRRWQKKGVLRTTLLNQMILLGDIIGISAQRLAEWYRS